MHTLHESVTCRTLLHCFCEFNEAQNNSVIADQLNDTHMNSSALMMLAVKFNSGSKE